MNPIGWLDDVIIITYLNLIPESVNETAGRLGRGILPKVVVLDLLLYDARDRSAVNLRLYQC